MMTHRDKTPLLKHYKPQSTIIKQYQPLNRYKPSETILKHHKSTMINLQIIKNTQRPVDPAHRYAHRSAPPNGVHELLGKAFHCILCRWAPHRGLWRWLAMSRDGRTQGHVALDMLR